MSALRDFSKVPFVLLGVYLLARLVMRPTTNATTIALSALFGGWVGFGFGFRTDLIIMAPFGFAVILSLLPGNWLREWKRNIAAAAAAMLTFFVVATPPLRGLATGGCQFHYSLLGLTDPMTESLGVHNGAYSLGGHFLDAFIDIKVGDRASRVLDIGVPNLCDPNYDLASGDLFFDFARTFPADLITRAYGAVLVVLRSGMQVPDVYGPLTRVPVLVQVLESIKRQPDVMGLLGPVFTFAAVCVAWAASARLGIALTAFVLFLTGYPAIEFESRHWFHLRFIPWWGLLLVSTVVWRHRELARERWRRGLVPATITVLLMVAALMAVRAYQQRSAATLADAYSAAAPRADADAAAGRRTSRCRLAPARTAPIDPNHRGSDMLVVTIDGRGCAPPGPFDLRIAYEFDNPAHDMSSTVRVRRASAGPTMLYFPIYMQGFLEQVYLRFTHLEVPGGTVDCISAGFEIRRSRGDPAVGRNAAAGGLADGPAAPVVDFTLGRFAGSDENDHSRRRCTT